MTTPKDTRWYIVLTMSGAEWQAYKGILKRGIDAYYPFMYADVRRGRWQQGAVKPQFPGYLFAARSAQESIEPVRQTIGVRDILRNGSNLVYLSSEQMQSCKRRCEEDRVTSLPHRMERIPIVLGDWIAIPSGAFIGVPAQVVGIDKSGNVRASIGSLDVTFHVSAIHGSVRGGLGHELKLPPTRATNTVNSDATRRWRA